MGGNMDKNDNNSMEQVRELLFGAQIKELEIQIKRMEEQFSRQLNDLNVAVNARFETHENFMRSESSSLLDKMNSENANQTNALKNEQNKRQDDVNSIRKENEKNLQHLLGDLKNYQELEEQKQQQFSSRLDTIDKELRKLMLTESGSLTKMLESRYNDLVDYVAETAAQIRNDMVCRTALSTMFIETAMKLNDSARTGTAESESDENG
jgi:hypothetical protein